MENWKELREKAGLTLEQLADKSGWAKGTIADLENHGQGGPRLKAKLRELLIPMPKCSTSEHLASSASELSNLEPRAAGVEYHTDDEWKQEALRLREEVKVLKSAIRIISSPSDPMPYPTTGVIRVNSKPLSAEEQIAIASAPAAHRLAQVSEPKQKAVAPSADKPAQAGGVERGNKK